MSEYPMELLNLAIDKARRLVSELEAKQAEVQANPPAIPPDQLAMGRMAMTNAIAAAKRSLAALEDAWAIAVKDLAETNEDEADDDDDIDEDESEI